MIKLTPDDYEALEGIRYHAGYKVLQRIAAEESQLLVMESAQAKTRHIQTGNVTTIETAESRVAWNGGVMNGMAKLLSYIDSAPQRVRKSEAAKES